MLSAKIREATKQAHRALEKEVVGKLKAVSSYKDYAQLLRCFYAYFNELEKAASPFITKELLPDYKARRNSSYLKNDIHELGYDTQSLPEVTVPQIGNTLSAFGALYVMEGSVMGGPIIVEMLKKKGIVKGVSFFSGYSPAMPGMWEAFISALNKLAATSKEEAMVIQSAEATFNNFRPLFSVVYAYQQ